jgi:hypothetical protein
MIRHQICHAPPRRKQLRFHYTTVAAGAVTVTQLVVATLVALTPESRVSADVATISWRNVTDGN